MQLTCPADIFTWKKMALTFTFRLLENFVRRNIHFLDTESHV